MECKVRMIQHIYIICSSIDLTRMECKAYQQFTGQTETTGIDLTRMECKVFIN